MKVILQRVSESQVRVDETVVGSIDKGLMLLVGIHQDDTEEMLDWICRKILNLRIFEDKQQKMNLSVKDVEGELLVVPQFTLYGDAEKGNRPSFVEAADPKHARKLYEQMIRKLADDSTVNVESGTFGAHMDVSLVNDGPVTIILER